MPYDIQTADETGRRPGLLWVSCGGSMLAGAAGYVNVVMLGFFSVPVSHMTGALSRLGMDIGAARLADFVLIGSIVLGFLSGAVVSGLIIGNATLKPGRRYGVALLGEGLLLALATLFALRGEVAAVPLAATALGLQNAMASSYRGLILRTTHVTGMVTDIGVLLGYQLRGRYIKAWKLWLLLTILMAFFAGGVLGMFALQWLGMAALGIAAAGCLAAGSIYFLALFVQRALGASAD